ncbi:hypothetical protein KA062_01860 [Patescibacteria group bacterium]|jgi:hypothetical protein|nr:hypothetical protein [Patescibacteria group bacterium]
MKKNKGEKEFIGTRDEACAEFYKQLASESKGDAACQRYYESLAKYHLKRVGDTSKKFKVKISTVN